MTPIEAEGMRRYKSPLKRVWREQKQEVATGRQRVERSEGAPGAKFLCTPHIRAPAPNCTRMRRSLEEYESHRNKRGAFHEKQAFCNSEINPCEFVLMPFSHKVYIVNA